MMQSLPAPSALFHTPANDRAAGGGDRLVGDLPCLIDIAVGEVVIDSPLRALGVKTLVE
jgi:hypothetical protein